jgi:hypothetical protein
MMGERDARGSSPRRESLHGSGIELIVWPLPGVASQREKIGVDGMSLRCFNPQFFIGSRVGDTALEADYPAMTPRFRQEMHIVIDALRALSTALPLEQMLPGDRLALERLQGLAQETDRVAKGDHDVADLSTAEVDDLIGRLRRLRRDDPASADRILRRLIEEAAPISARLQ